MIIGALLLFAVIIAGAGFLAWRTRRRNNRDPASGTAREDAYHCVVIEPAEAACDAAKALLGTRFLPEEAPRLPLPQCTQPCRCHFAHYRDRREEYRRNPYGQGVCMPPRAVGGDRRGGTDRRESQP